MTISTTIRTLFAILLTLMLTQGIFGSCSPTEDDTLAGSADKEVVRLFIPSETAEPEFALPDGTKGQGWAAYREAVTAYMATAGDSVAIEFSETPLVSGPGAPTSTTSGEFGRTSNPLFIKIPFTGYGARVDFYASKKVSCKCFTKTGPAANFMFSKLTVNPPLVDLHIVVYNENGKPCVGLYNSGSVGNFCWTKCGPSYNDIKNGIYTAVLAVGVGATIASVVAEVATPVVIGGLGLAL